MHEFLAVAIAVVFALRRALIVTVARPRFVLFPRSRRQGHLLLQQSLRVQMSVPRPGATQLVARHLSALLLRSNFMQPFGVVDSPLRGWEIKDPYSPSRWREPEGHWRPDLSEALAMALIRREAALLDARPLVLGPLW